MPYLNFTGDCEEAFRLYQRAFDGPEPVFARYGDAPDSAYPGLDAAQKNKIMHGHVMLTETSISGADAVWPIEKGLRNTHSLDRRFVLSVVWRQFRYYVKRMQQKPTLRLYNRMYLPG